MPAGQTESRKGEHVAIVLDKDVQHRQGTGFDGVCFEHCAMPEIDIAKVGTRVKFLGKELALPLMVTGMTGGYAAAERINKDLAAACEERGAAFGLGSQRAMVENPGLEKTYLVRKEAPSVFLCANIGAYQLRHYAEKHELARIETLVERTDADALCIHFNPLQEAIQPEGDRDWTGIAAAIERTCSLLSVPVIAKETGAGISGTAAKRLAKLGVAAIDVSGAGGTSWSAVELEREKDGRRMDEFRDWGIPTADALRQCRAAVALPLIASGGLRNGLDVAKALRLGATLGGAAYPFIKAQAAGGKDGVKGELDMWERSLRTALFLTGSKDVAALKKAPLLSPC